ncbi:lysozyme inhibitor LprI family protein [Stagnihabitans tardus]|uniref:DUF1311 domain-containing protein n=1 Tax=Stagnihabitans tardus TaxID=2699202 RepID=A0AAE4Y832_9RHOB|nr:lysozyme inhibitor LprI family protein [Stagnihabitans tardus]NBZ86927.1 DUF1311 domain-containing protein [Stagnihabitans tardus]
MTRFLAALALALTPTSALALTEDECMALHPEITSAVEMVDCTMETEAGEKALAEALTSLRAVLPEDLWAQQEAAQAAWSAWRDAECAFEAAPYPGSGGTGVEIQCRANLTLARRQQLVDAAELWKP